MTDLEIVQEQLKQLEARVRDLEQYRALPTYRPYIMRQNGDSDVEHLHPRTLG